MPTFGEILKKLRTEADLTQKQLADMAHIGQNTIARYELGDREPSWESVQLLARALKVSFEAFANLPDEEPSTKKDLQESRKNKSKAKKKD